MNNLSLPKNYSAKVENKQQKEEKPKKKISYKKEIEDLAKIKSRLEEKYESISINRVFNSILEIETAIQNLKRVEYDSF